MKFSEFDEKMRVYEESLDQIIPPETYMVARIDGRSFSRLTKEICNFEAPFDVRFRDMMINTVKELMNCGFRIAYGYTESDEISLLFEYDENAFGRKVRKYNSVLASVAGSAFSLQLGRAVAFDCRMIPLPNKRLVEEYFLWRQEDANRNALNSHCYWMLRKEGVDALSATKQLEGRSVSFKNELLFSRGINYNELPLWQKRGVGIYWSNDDKKGYNPITGCETLTQRRCLKTDLELPLKNEYSEMISKFITV